MTISKPRRVRTWPVVAVRVLSAIFCAGTFTQAALAGRFVTGNVDLLEVHAGVGGSLLLVPLAMLPASLALWRLSGGPPWHIAYPFVLAALIVVQLVAGSSRNLALHIPLGASLLGLAVWHATWSFRYQRHRASQAVGTLAEDGS